MHIKSPNAQHTTSHHSTQMHAQTLFIESMFNVEISKSLCDSSMLSGIFSSIFVLNQSKQHTCYNFTIINRHFSHSLVAFFRIFFLFCPFAHSSIPLRSCSIRFEKKNLYTQVRANEWRKMKHEKNILRFFVRCKNCWYYCLLLFTFSFSCAHTRTHSHIGVTIGIYIRFSPLNRPKLLCIHTCELNV